MKIWHSMHWKLFMSHSSQIDLTVPPKVIDCPGGGNEEWDGR